MKTSTKDCAFCHNNVCLSGKVELRGGRASDGEPV